MPGEPLGSTHCRMTLGDYGGHAIVVIGVGGGKRRHGCGRLVQHGTHVGAVIDLFPGQCRRDDLPGVSAVKIATGECQDCPPAVVRGSALQDATASSVNQTVKLPRWRNAASYAAEFMTMRFC